MKRHSFEFKPEGTRKDINAKTERKPGDPVLPQNLPTTGDTRPPENLSFAPKEQARWGEWGAQQSQVKGPLHYDQTKYLQELQTEWGWRLFPGASRRKEPTERHKNVVNLDARYLKKVCASIGEKNES